MNSIQEIEEPIDAILGEDNDSRSDNAQRYMDHLRRVLKLPLRVTGREDFPWEEPYVIGDWSQAEYRKLKETQPSYTDKFDLFELAEPEEDEVVARIRRISDGKGVAVGCSWLECVKKKEEAFQVLEDYAMWYANY